MIRILRGYKLSSGRELSAVSDILGIQPGERTLYYGYDGWFIESTLEDSDEPKLTAEERAEIADYMIALWKEWKTTP